MRTVLLLGIHCHQPVGNFDEVVYDAIARSYKPFFQVLKAYPKFRISVHYSGWLLEFIQKNDLELFGLMQSLSDQIEFFSGGYYEPILASIPSQDRIAQITKLNNFIKTYFHQTPKGLWLTERVWDNSIIQDLKSCGIEYAIVDDYHFIVNGFDKERLKGYFITEEGGEALGLFPIDQTLRYAVPFYPQQKVNEILHRYVHEEGKNAAIIFDDGEKFGIWPHTYETVYEKEWLRAFIENCLADEMIAVQTFKEFYEEHHAISLAYLSTVSYQEMGEWSLLADDTLALEGLLSSNPNYEKFIKGGTWKNFLIKYQESNWIHKRMLELSKKQIDSQKYKEALYKAQCNDVLWHGVFGGIYLPNLRDNAYRFIMECEEILGEKSSILDTDFDGVPEYKMHSENLLAIVSPGTGGQIFELDIKDRYFNLQNTLTRYKEAYHTKIVFDESQEMVEKKSKEITTIHDNKLVVDSSVILAYDWYLKKSGIDHICDETFTIENFKYNRFKELGDFTDQPYKVLKYSHDTLSLQREGGIYNETRHDAFVNKAYQIKQNEITLHASIHISYNQNLNYVNEWNLHFPNVSSVIFNGQKLGGGLVFHTSKLVMIDMILDKELIFECDRMVEMIIVPIESVSQSERGVDFTLQGVSFAFVYKFGDSLETTVSLKIENCPAISEPQR
ncbi:MAG: DUF1926 domain-containing protein [Campylobacterales bacterium]|nr:DUF1926 domain-containing protein [Campylobacterales bacterium]